MKKYDPKITESRYLACPNCGFEFGLHHGAVMVYGRSEDNPETLVTRVHDGTATTRVVPSSRSGNPSTRRDGVAINLWCECCQEEGMQLTIEQHKGATILGVRQQGDPQQ